MFFYDYQDAQYPSTVRDPTSGLLESRFFNLEKATSMGAELETVWAVTDAFVMRLNYSYLDTEIDDARCFVDGGDTGISGSLQPDARPCTTPALGQQTAQLLDGGELPSAPNHKVAFNANYTFFTGVGNLTLGTTYTYRDEAYYSVFSRDHYLAPSYDNVDFRALWNGNDNKYTFIAFVNNAFDDTGYEAAGATHVGMGCTEPHAVADGAADVRARSAVPLRQLRNDQGRARPAVIRCRSALSARLSISKISPSAPASRTAPALPGDRHPESTSESPRTHSASP